MPRRHSVDLAVSLFSLQAINDLPGALAQIRRALKPDGLFVGALFGGATLRELRDSFAHAESETLGGISPARLAVRAMCAIWAGCCSGPVLPCRSPMSSAPWCAMAISPALVRDLRAHGQTNVMTERSRKFPPPRHAGGAAVPLCARTMREDGKLNATFEIVYLTGWAPHASQQQPLKPGSAKSRLADALGVAETIGRRKSGTQAADCVARAVTKIAERS